MGSESGPGEATPVDRLLDLAVFGPLGLALEAREMIPRWAEAGRRQVASQLTMARAVGRLAVDQGGRQAGPALARLVSSAEELLGELGIMFRDDARPGEDAGADQGAGTDATARPGEGPEGPAVPPAKSPAAGSGGTPSDGGSGLDPAQLAIPGYDTLSASQVVQRLTGLAPEELEAVRVYELAGRGRKTILLKVAQLRAAP